MSARTGFLARTALAALAALLACAGAASAQSKAGTTIGQFLLVEPSARMAALGNAASSFNAGIDGVYYNPASAAELERYEAVFSSAEWLAGTRLNYIGFGMPLGRFGGVFATFTSLGSGDMLVRTVESPLGTGEQFSVNDVALGLGYARQITDRFSVGGQVHWMQESIWHSTTSAATASFGTLYRVSDRGFRLGSSLAYFGTQGRYSGSDLRLLYDSDPERFGDNGSLPANLAMDAFDMPVVFRVGVGQTFDLGKDAKLDAVLDALHPNDQQESVSAGLELVLRRTMALRAGWQDAFLTDAETGPTAGFGYLGRYDDYGYRVDYAWADFGRLGDVHRLSFGITFGGNEE